ncbi:hypothetical protein COUCH_00635 [Couchioplanes caeruleus]|uniref:hypothetical protein n=1 Tax=Couchioplanes caeruleus TaxID=56438 RepID=UPI0020BFEDF0|nr:hypothetical protein [Couchioplanes caeruleus]UQU64907.1 hypothetical protein COUCH_00635 [Couchioplanes caeruleus]
MSTSEEALAAARTKPEYRSGIWAFRAMLVLAAVLVPNIALSFLPRGIEIMLWLAYLAVVLFGLLKFSRAGVRITGTSQDVWSRRRVVYKDVMGLGRR